MTNDIDNLFAKLRERRPNAKTDDSGVLSLVTCGVQISFTPIPGNLSAVLVRARLMPLDEVGRPEEFAIAALAGNFMWSGARGATISVGPDDVLYISQCALLEYLKDDASIDACLSDFVDSVEDWRIRGGLYA